MLVSRLVEHYLTASYDEKLQLMECSEQHFFHSATFGVTLSGWIDAPPAYMAAVGFIAVFAVAANTPLACVLMGVELFGAGMAVPVAIVTFIGYAVSGATGIYAQQRLWSQQHPVPVVDAEVSQVHEARGRWWPHQ